MLTFVSMGWGTQRAKRGAPPYTTHTTIDEGLPMSYTLEDIKRPVKAEVEQFHQRFDEILMSRSQWLEVAVRHLSRSTGKMVRPIMTTLMAGMLSGRVSDKTITSAILLELIHTATLIHDDVIDEAHTRRGYQTLNAIYDNRVAVLMGDFILSSALIGAIQTADLRIIGIVSAIGRELTEGEIRQYETADNVTLDEEVYTEVIRQKTAVLFRSCAEVACISSEASEEDILRLGRCGELLGLAFQIRDDIFDYYSDDVGKPTGNDIREGKVTLPLLHALLHDGGSTPEGQALLSALHSRTLTPEIITRMIHFAKERGGIDYAYTRLSQLITEAKALLETYPESPYRTSLLALADFIALRKV